MAKTIQENNSSSKLKSVVFTLIKILAISNSYCDTFFEWHFAGFQNH